jgi:RNA polymerase sigma factor (sigma-70 family)
MFEKAKGDQALVKEAEEGSQEALGELYRRYHDLVFHSALLTCNSKEDAEEAADDVFLAILKRPLLLEGAKNVATYLFVAGKNAALNRRKTSSQTSLELDESIVAGEEDKNYSISKQILAFLKGTLNEDEYTIFVLHEGFDYSFRDIALFLNEGENSVSSRFFRAKQKVLSADKPMDLNL